MELILSLVVEQCNLHAIKKMRRVSKTCYNIATNQLYKATKVYQPLTQKYVKPHQKICLINRTTQEFVRLPRYRVPVVLMALLTRHKDIADKKYGSRWKLTDKLSVCTKYRIQFDSYNAILYL